LLLPHISILGDLMLIHHIRNSFILIRVNAPDMLLWIGCLPLGDIWVWPRAMSCWRSVRWNLSTFWQLLSFIEWLMYGLTAAILLLIHVILMACSLTSRRLRIRPFNKARPRTSIICCSGFLIISEWLYKLCHFFCLAEFQWFFYRLKEWW